MRINKVTESSIWAQLMKFRMIVFLMITIVVVGVVVDSIDNILYFQISTLFVSRNIPLYKLVKIHADFSL